MAAIPALIRLLDDDFTDIQFQAMGALARFGPAAEPAIPALLRLLKNEKPKIRQSAVSSLGIIGRWQNDSTEIDALTKVQEDEGEDPLVLIHATVSLTRLSIAAESKGPGSASRR
jgi:HEAT repeat protein